MLEGLKRDGAERFSIRDLLAHYADVRARLMGAQRRPVMLRVLPPPSPESASFPAKEPPPAGADPIDALPADVVLHVVQACAEVDGLLDRVMKWLLVYNDLRPGELTCELADEHIARAREALNAPKISIGAILQTTSAHYGVSRVDIISHRRTADVVRPRQVAMYLAKTLTPRSLPEIGRRIGGRDHTTVLHAVRKIGSLIEHDAALAADVAEISAKVRVEAGL